MAVKTEKASEVKSFTATPTDSDKVLGYNSTNGAGFWTLSNFLNWIKNKTRSTIAAGDKTPVNSDAVNSALANYTKSFKATRNGTTFTFDLSSCSVGDVIEINCFNSNDASCYSANWIKDSANSIFLIGVLKNNSATITKSGTTLTVTLTGSVGGCCIGKASVNH